MKKLIVILLVSIGLYLVVIHSGVVCASEPPENAIFEVTFAELEKNHVEYENKNILLVGWLRGKEDIDDSRYSFFTLGAGDAREVTLILDNHLMGPLPNRAQGKPFVVTGEYVEEIFIRLDDGTVRIVSALLLDTMMLEWSWLN